MAHPITTHETVALPAGGRDAVVELLQLITVALAILGLATVTPVGRAAVEAATQDVLTAASATADVVTSVVTPDCAEEDGSGQGVCTWHGDRQGDGSGDSVLIIGGRDLAHW